MNTYGDGQATTGAKSKNKSDTSDLGLTEPLSDDFKVKNLPDFLLGAFAEFVQYRANVNIEIG